MAKKKSPRAAISTPAPTPTAAASAGRDSVGWGFWLLSFGVLYVPSWFLCYRYTYASDRDGFVPYVLAFALAAFGAGVLSYAVNLYYRIRDDARKKAARKSKKQVRNQ